MRGEKEEEEEEEESLLSVWFYVTCASARAVLYRRWAFVRKNFIDTTTLLRSRQRPLDAPSSRLFECWTPPPPFSFCSALPSYSFFSFLFFASCVLRADGGTRWTTSQEDHPHTRPWANPQKSAVETCALTLISDGGRGRS